MRALPIIVWICIATGGLSAVAQESELVRLCPEMPCWVQFAHEGVSIDDTGNRVEVSGNNVLRFLYTTTIDEEEHWWIEFESSFTDRGLLITSTHRLLIPEEALRFGKNPLAAVKQAWYYHSQMVRKEAMELDPKRDDWVKPWFTRALVRFDYEPETELLLDQSESVKDVDYRCRSFCWTEQPSSGTETDKQVEHKVLVAAEGHKLPLALINWVTKTAKLEEKGDFEFKFQLVDFGDDPQATIALDDDP